MPGKSKSKNGAVGRDPSLCYLCGLAIPDQVVSRSHPLFGTVDHVIASSRGGTDAIWNRAPAHLVCNREKGNGLINPEEFAASMHATIVPLLARLGHPVTRAPKTSDSPRDSRLALLGCNLAQGSKWDCASAVGRRWRSRSRFRSPRISLRWRCGSSVNRSARRKGR